MKSDAKATGSDGNKTLLSAASALTSMAEPESEGNESPRSAGPEAEMTQSSGDNGDEGDVLEVRIDDDVPMTFPQRVRLGYSALPAVAYAALRQHDWNTKQTT
eukprot:scaffold67514_cov56-Attheya_sp.AAC.1